MIQQDFYTGEPSNLGSPNISSDAEAAGMASFGKYDYDSGSRNIYFSNPNQQMNQPQQYGIGSPYYTPYGNVAPNRPYFGNQFQWQNQMMMQTPAQPTVTHISGFNPGGSEFLPTTDWEEKIDELEMDYWFARQEEDVKAEMNTQQSAYGSYNAWGYNYYGMPYFNPYRYNSIDNEFSRKIDKIKDEARENRVKFNINLLKVAHSILDDGVTEEEIVQMCTGKDVQNSPTAFGNPQDYYQQARYANLVPFDNSSYYSNARANRQKELDKIVPPDGNMKDTFDALGVLYATMEMEEESHRRKDKSSSYNSNNNAYKYYIKRKAQERYAAEHGMAVKPENQFNSAFGNQILSGLPTLSQNATIADDGTLNVSLSLPVNIGSHQGEVYTISNENEAEYEKKREQFGKFLGSIKSDIYLDDLKNKKFEDITML